MASTLKVQNIAHTGGTTAATVESDGTIKYPQQPRFSAVASNSANSNAAWTTVGTPANNHSPIPFDVEIVDSRGAFNPSTFKYTVPVSGDYFLYFHAISGNSDDWIRVSFVMNRSGTYYHFGQTQTDYAGTANTDYSNCAMQGIFPFLANDQIWVALDNNTDVSVYCGGSSYGGGIGVPPNFPANSARWNGFGGYMLG